MTYRLPYVTGERRIRIDVLKAFVQLAQQTFQPLVFQFME